MAPFLVQTGEFRSQFPEVTCTFCYLHEKERGAVGIVISLSINLVFARNIKHFKAS